ncbi:hypothetical protein OROHE_004007 [Orobanche hederae]
MAFSSNILLALVLVSIGSSTISSAQSNNVTLAGVVTCPDASLSAVGTYRVIPQAKVDVVCPVLFFPRVAKSTMTNFVGVYSFSFGPSEILFSNPELCYLNVTLPVNSCKLDPPGGAIRFPIIGIRSFFGMVMAYIPGAPRYVAA